MPKNRNININKKTRKRGQKGGFWPFTSSNSTQSWKDYFISSKKKLIDYISSYGGYFPDYSVKPINAIDDFNTEIGNVATSFENNVVNPIGESLSDISSTPAPGPVQKSEQLPAQVEAPVQPKIEAPEQPKIEAPEQPKIEAPVPALNPPGSSVKEPQKTYGGKNKTKKHQKGGNKLGLTYYATPVQGLKVAIPTTMQYYAQGTNQYSVKTGGSIKHKKTKNKKTRKSK